MCESLTDLAGFDAICMQTHMIHILRTVLPANVAKAEGPKELPDPSRLASVFQDVFTHEV